VLRRRLALARDALQHLLPLTRLLKERPSLSSRAGARGRQGREGGEADGLGRLCWSRAPAGRGGRRGIVDRDRRRAGGLAERGRRRRESREGRSSRRRSRLLRGPRRRPGHSPAAACRHGLGGAAAGLDEAGGPSSSSLRRRGPGRQRRREVGRVRRRTGLRLGRPRARCLRSSRRALDAVPDLPRGLAAERLLDVDYASAGDTGVARAPSDAAAVGVAAISPRRRSLRGEVGLVLRGGKEWRG
jgi:hypothetical protein